MARLLPTALATLALVCIAPLAAQDDDDDFDDNERWLEDCRDGSWGWRRSERRERHCEVRETGMRPGGTQGTRCRFQMELRT